jgi:hypothetical protein
VVVVDNGLIAEPHTINPFGFQPENHFAAVGFASLSGHPSKAAMKLATSHGHQKQQLQQQCLGSRAAAAAVASGGGGDGVWGGARGAAKRAEAMGTVPVCGLTMYTQQAVGVASVGTGSMDVVLHRRLMQADEKGITEVLNDVW